METHHTNMSQVCGKLKQIRGESSKGCEIPYIETLAGNYTGKNVLEGFCKNTEILCNEDNISTKFDNNFTNMCVEDNAIIFEVSSKEDVKIPNMKICDLKDILFKKLRLDKA